MFFDSWQRKVRYQGEGDVDRHSSLYSSKMPRRPPFPDPSGAAHLCLDPRLWRITVPGIRRIAVARILPLIKIAFLGAEQHVALLFRQDNVRRIPIVPARTEVSVRRNLLCGERMPLEIVVFGLQRSFRCLIGVSHQANCADREHREQCSPPENGCRCSVARCHAAVGRWSRHEPQPNFCVMALFTAGREATRSSHIATFG